MAKFYTAYKITSVDAHDIAVIVARYGKDLIAITHEGECGEFIVTATSGTGSVVREIIRVVGTKVQVIGRAVVLAAA